MKKLKTFSVDRDCFGALSLLSDETGFSLSEIVRRAVAWTIQPAPQRDVRDITTKSWVLDPATDVRIDRLASDWSTSRAQAVERCIDAYIADDAAQAALEREAARLKAERDARQAEARDRAAAAEDRAQAQAQHVLVDLTDRVARLEQDLADARRALRRASDAPPPMSSSVAVARRPGRPRTRT